MARLMLYYKSYMSTKGDNMKRIAYLVNDNGVDGMGQTRTLYATFDASERDALLELDKSKAWRSTAETIIDEEKAVETALAKLNGIDRLVLGLRPWPATNWLVDE
jgi:hypothetical protein